MGRSLRTAVVCYAALLSAGAAFVVGCAASTEVDMDGVWPDASTETGTKDGRAWEDDSSAGSGDDDGSTSQDSGEEAAADEEDDGGVDGDAGDAGGDADVSGPDAGDAGGEDEDDGGDAGDPKGSTPTRPTQGQVVISEVMFRPGGAEPDAEWLEVHNTSATPKLLSGLTLRDKARSHVIGPDVTVAAGAYVVLVRDKATAVAANVPAGSIVYEYGTGLNPSAGIQMTNDNTGVLTLSDGSTEIARAKYGPIGISSVTKGQSIQLKVLTYAAAAAGGNWCKSASSWVAGSDKGTPGAASDCP